MAQVFSRKEKYVLNNCLNCLPIILQDQAVLIDLENEISVAGRIDNADANMNIHLKEAVLIDRNNLQYAFDEFMVRERKIRQIHLPADMELEAELRNWFKNGMGKRHRNADVKKKTTFKQKRAEMRHKEILNEIQTKKTNE